MSYYTEEDNIQNYWELRYQEWIKNPDWAVFEQKDKWFEARFSHILPQRVPRGRVLEVGCGNSMYAVPLLRRFETYTGFDTSPTAIEIARTYYKNHPELSKRMSINFYTGKPGRWEPNVQNWYDCIISITVLQHQPLTYRLAMIENIKRLLKPGGLYVGLEWSDSSSLAYDMPPIEESVWRQAWLPLVIERDLSPEHPEWRADNIWVAR